jgi:hypothetical protein
MQPIIRYKIPGGNIEKVYLLFAIGPDIARVIEVLTNGYAIRCVSILKQPGLVTPGELIL